MTSPVTEITQELLLLSQYCSLDADFPLSQVNGVSFVSWVTMGSDSCFLSLSKEIVIMRSCFIWSCLVLHLPFCSETNMVAFYMAMLCFFKKLTPYKKVC